MPEIGATVDFAVKYASLLQALDSDIPDDGAPALVELADQAAWEASPKTAGVIYYWPEA